MLGLCVSLGRGWLGEPCGFVGFLGGLLLLRMCLEAGDGLVWGVENEWINIRMLHGYTGRDVFGLGTSLHTNPLHSVISPQRGCHTSKS
jgi:hypothetical protein